ncbi:hypothetical protein RCL_jg29162.t1 [Rhizophagus clarus]|uniref:Uncharacterized protein n=1 Tax=Rhizophagus clarus TaxID=94130 RepID=A0A8H3M233_9GLOM|nr:hypothetical protein RCL_jg29162.t1 [Rhizophagus clarus]
MFDNFTDYGTTLVVPQKKALKRTDILPKYEDKINVKDSENHDILLELEHLKEVKEVQVLIDKFDFNKVFMAKEFIEYDKSKPKMK